MRNRFALATLAVLAHPALAQDADTQRELIRRDRQGDAFNLQLRQSQERRPLVEPSQPPAIVPPETPRPLPLSGDRATGDKGSRK